MLVRMWMAKDLTVVEPTLTVSAALKILAEKKIRRLPVVKNGALVGIVVLGDLSRAQSNPNLPVEQVMAKHPATVHPDMAIEDAGAIMRDRRIGAIPVIDKGKLVGIITETDIFRALMEVLGMKVEGTRIAVEIGKEPRDFYELMKLVGETDRMMLSVVIYSSYSREKSLVVLRIEGADHESLTQKLWKSQYRVVQVS